MRHQWDLSGWNCVTLHTVDPVRRARFFSQITRDCRRSLVPAHAPSFACVGHIRDQKAMTADLDEIEKVAAEIARNVARTNGQAEDWLDAGFVERTVREQAIEVLTRHLGKH
jgi:hypothetical protein